MKRSILMSLLVIGGAIALLAGAGTFAPFTSTDSDSGDVTAGTVAITVVGTGTIDFASGDLGCDLNLAPGDTCGPDTVTVENTGSLPVTLSDPVPSESGDLETCGDGDNLTTTVGALSDTTLDPTETATFDVEVTLEADADNDCQGATGTIEVEVTATNS